MPIVEANVAHVCFRAWVPSAGADLPFVAYRKALAVMCVITVVGKVLPRPTPTALLLSRWLFVASRRRRRCASRLLRTTVDGDSLQRLLMTHNISHCSDGCITLDIGTGFRNPSSDEEGRFGEAVGPPRPVAEESCEGCIPRARWIEL